MPRRGQPSLPGGGQPRTASAASVVEWQTAESGRECDAPRAPVSAPGLGIATTGPNDRQPLVSERLKSLLNESRMPEMGTSGLMSGEWKRSAWWDIQTPATERAGHSYGPPSRHRATPRLHNCSVSHLGWYVFSVRSAASTPIHLPVAESARRVEASSFRFASRPCPHPKGCQTVAGG